MASAPKAKKESKSKSEKDGGKKEPPTNVAFTSVKFLGVVKKFSARPGKTGDEKLLEIVGEFPLTASGLMVMADLGRLTNGRTVEFVITETMGSLPFKDDRKDDQGKLDLEAGGKGKEKSKSKDNGSKKRK